MKPYGRYKKVRFPDKIDCHPHPKKKLVNWWENMYNCLSRRKMKQLLKRSIDRDVEDI